MRRVFLRIVFVGLLLSMVYFGVRENSSPVAPSTKAKGASIIPSLPVYPGATLVRETTIPDPAIAEFARRYQAVWTVSAAVPTISAWYQRAIVGSGWSLNIKPADTSTNIQLISFTQAAGARTINISLVTKGNVSEITLDYIPGPISEMEMP